MTLSDRFQLLDMTSLAAQLEQERPGGTNCRQFAGKPTNCGKLTKLSLIREGEMEFGAKGQVPFAAYGVMSGG